LKVPADEEPGLSLDPQDDPDFISEDGQDGHPGAGPLAVRGGIGSPTPVFVPKESTPLEEEDDDEGAIPHAALWVLKYRKHGGFWGGSEAPIRERHGRGDGTVFVIDDGRKHCVVTRQVGTSPDGCTYFLVGQISIASYEDLFDDEVRAETIFAGARDTCLCVVYEAADAVSNVAVVESFDSIEEVPLEYLPPSPAITFADADQ
jgi:hypothetical protein